MLDYQKLYKEEKTKNSMLVQRIVHLENILKTSQDTINELEIEANLDPLTRLFNRRGMYKILLNHLLGASIQNIYTLVNIDLDNFKNVNDELGHKVGDEVLIGVANIFRSKTRPHDIVVRSGGDEFYILFANNDMNSIVQRTIQIQEAVETLGIKTFKAYDKELNMDKRLSFSAGITTYELQKEIETSQPNSTEIKFMVLDQLLQETDLKIYESKSSGKGLIINCITEDNELELTKK